MGAFSKSSKSDHLFPARYFSWVLTCIVTMQYINPCIFHLTFKQIWTVTTQNHFKTAQMISLVSLAVTNSAFGVAVVTLQAEKPQYPGAKIWNINIVAHDLVVFMHRRLCMQLLQCVKINWTTEDHRRLLGTADEVPSDQRTKPGSCAGSSCRGAAGRQEIFLPEIISESF